MYICIVCSQYMYVNSLCQIYVQYCTHIYKRHKKQRYFLLQQCSCLKRNFDVVEFFHWTLIWETNCCTQPTFPVMIAERKKWHSTRSISESIKCSLEYSYICIYRYTITFHLKGNATITWQTWSSHCFVLITCHDSWWFSPASGSFWFWFLRARTTHKNIWQYVLHDSISSKGQDIQTNWRKGSLWIMVVLG